jgi:hypothetical protein
MVNITLAIPEEIKKKMDSFPEMNWSEVARQAIVQRIKDMEFLKKFTTNSQLTEEDALRLGKELKKGIAKRHGLVKK